MYDLELCRGLANIVQAAGCVRNRGPSERLGPSRRQSADMLEVRTEFLPLVNGLVREGMRVWALCHACLGWWFCGRKRAFG